MIAFGIGASGTDLLQPTPDDAFTPTTVDPRIRAETTGEQSGAESFSQVDVAFSYRAAPV